MQENYINKKSYDAMVIDGFEDDKDNIKSQKRKLIDNEEMAYRQHEKLEKGKRMTYEMEKISIDVAGSLNQQNKKMNNIRDNVFQMNSDVDHSNSLLTSMSNRQNRNKRIIIISAVILGLILGGVLLKILL